MELDDVQRWHIGNLAVLYYGELTARTLLRAEMHYRRYVVDQWALTRIALREQATGQRPSPETVIVTYINYFRNERNLR